MSEGRIKAWRRGSTVPPASTRPGRSVHAVGVGGRALCGRRGQELGSAVTCSDCLAAQRADEAVSS